MITQLKRNYCQEIIVRVGSMLEDFAGHPCPVTDIPITIFDDRYEMMIRNV